MPGVFHATQKDKAAWACDSIFHFVVEVKVFCIFVERNTTFGYAYRFIRKCCIFHMYVTISVGYRRLVPKLLSSWVHGMAPGRKKKTFEVSKECSAVCS
jgi:hypothetical protein